VIFTSDHGFFLGEHGFGGKWLMYEPSIRIPMIVRAPDLPPAMRGASRDEMALNIDVAPTILEAAGVAPALQLDGRSLWPLVHGEKPDDCRSDFFYRFHYGRSIPTCEGIRTKSLKYIAYYGNDRHFQKITYEQLFDLESDPREAVNLAGQQDHRETLDRLRARYVALRRQTYPDSDVPEFP
jgi:arylsulfatase A-like enzyme